MAHPERLTPTQMEEALAFAHVKRINGDVSSAGAIERLCDSHEALRAALTDLRNEADREAADAAKELLAATARAEQAEARVRELEILLTEERDGHDCVSRRLS